MLSRTWLRAKGAILLLPRRVSRSGSKGCAYQQSYFNLLGVSAAMGRNFLPGEDQPGHDQVVILSDGLWQRRFASNPKVLRRGRAPQWRQLQGGRGHAEGYRLGFYSPQLWTPLVFPPTKAFSLHSARTHSLNVMARLKSGVSVARGKG